MIYMSDYYVMTDCGTQSNEFLNVILATFWMPYSENFSIAGIRLTEKLDFWRMKLFAGLVATVSSIWNMVGRFFVEKSVFRLRHCRMKSLLHSNVDQEPFINMAKVMEMATVLLNGTKLLPLKTAGLDVSLINHSLVTEPTLNVKWKLTLLPPTMVLSDTLSAWTVFLIIMHGVCQGKSCRTRLNFWPEVF